MSLLATLAPGATALPTAAATDRVDVWQARLDLSPGDGAASLLRVDAADRARAARLRAGGWRWLASRAALRTVLAHYLGLEPARVPIVAGANDKPRLGSGAGPDLRFSLTHTGDIALVAVRLAHEVGVDAEEVREGVDMETLARDHFGAAERAMYAALGAEGRRVAFFHAWVRREALAKATGRGLAAPADDRERERFAVRLLSGVPGCAAAVASEGAGWRVLRAALPD